MFTSDYIVFRSDRDYESLGCSRGGGVLIAVKSDNDSRRLSNSNDPAIEDVWVLIKAQNILLVSGCVYFRPNSSVDLYQKFLTTVEIHRTKYKTAKFLITGDFNLPSVGWTIEDNVLIPSDLTSPMAESLITGMMMNELQQANYHPNEFGKYLDLIFCDEFDNWTVRRADFPLSVVVRHHIPLEMQFLVSAPTNKLAYDEEPEFNFEKADYDRLNNHFLSIDWSWIQECTNVNTIIESFYKIIYNGIENFIPRRNKKQRKYPRWYTKDTKIIISKKNKAYQKFKVTKSLEDYRQYSKLRRESKHFIQLSYLLYVTNTEQMIPKNIKFFWAYVNSLKKDSGIPSTMELNNIKQTPKDIANAFADHFESCYSSDRRIDLSVVTENECVSLVRHSFHRDDVWKKLHSLDTTKSTGPDGLPASFLKKCCDSLAHPLSLIYQSSFDHGSFPKLWKHSWVIPIFKSGSKRDIKNYRGISLLPILSKIFESLITDELFEAFKSHITVDQHGFFKGRSTGTNLAVFQDYVVNAVESGSQVDTIYTDLTKAFDRVSHQLLINRLTRLGVCGPYIQWIESYLTKRQQCVKVGSTVSREINVLSGVPQGSHLGPVLFLIFINSVTSVFQKCKCLLYADDLKLFCAVDSSKDCVDIQTDLNNLVKWCSLNNLEINTSKCRILNFYKRKNRIHFNYCIDSKPLQVVNSFNDLGVIFSSDLSFNSHIDNILLKASRMLGFLRRTCYDICDTGAIKSMYNCLVRSVLEYNSVIWSPVYNCHINRLESVQNKFAKFILYKLKFPYCNVSYMTRTQLVGIETLETRRCKALVLFLYKLLNGHIDCHTLLSHVDFRIPNRTTRSQQLFNITFHRTTYGTQSFSNRLLSNYNTNFSDLDLFRYSVTTFKNKIRYKCINTVTLRQRQ